MAERVGWGAKLEKVYDRINWSFLEYVLRYVDFQDTLVGFIMNCTSQASFLVLWNGSLVESFTPSRGIGQGTPYLFTFLPLISLPFCSPYGGIQPEYSCVC